MDQQAFDFNPKKKKTAHKDDGQCARLLDYMRAGTWINQRIALNELSIARLASRICNLRDDGHEIEKEMVKDFNKFGQKVDFARYRITRINHDENSTRC